LLIGIPYRNRTKITIAMKARAARNADQLTRMQPTLPAGA